MTSHKDYINISVRKDDDFTAWIEERAKQSGKTLAQQTKNDLKMLKAILNTPGLNLEKRAKALEITEAFLLKMELEQFVGLKLNAEYALYNLFTKQEAMCLVDTMNGYLHNTGINAKVALVADVVDNIRLNQADKKWELPNDGKNLVEKLEGLGQVEAQVVLDWTKEIWSFEQWGEDEIVKLFHCRTED